MRRLAVTAVALCLVLPLLVAWSSPSTADEPRPPGFGKGLDYDLERVRQAQQRAVEQVGPMPADVGEYFAEHPAFLFHERGSHRDLPKILHTTVEDLPEMQERLRRYLATRYRTMAAEAAEDGEPLVFKVPTLLFRIHGDEWQEESSPERFEDLLSGIGTSSTGTVTEMYLEQSFGNMVVDFDVYGPYDSAISNNPANNCHYGTEGAPITGDVLGLGGLGSRGMAAEAVPMSDPDIDYGQYDNDLDGWVDFLMIIHSGPDAAATGNPCHVWSHYFGSIVGEPTTTTNDRNAEGQPVVVGPVMTVPEVDLQIGVTAHELMHALGEPDYYGTAGTAGTGDWDLGAGGSWLGIPAQTNPVHFNPVMKINFGWLQPRMVTGTMRDVSLLPRANYPDALMVPLQIAKADSEAAEQCDQAPVGIPHQNDAFYTEEGDCLVEGFLIENLNRNSAFWDQDRCVFAPADFDRQIYASGLMVWHWDFTNYQQLGNNNVLRPMLDVEEFDRRDDTQDLSRNITRAQPLDLFWGDPVGMTGATQVSPEAAEVDPPEDSPWTVTSPPTGGAVAATPVPEWEAAAALEGVGMSVTLSWDVPTDDWDLYVDKMVDGEWVQVQRSAGGAPQTQEKVTIFDFDAGEQFRARAYNWFGPTSPQAEVSVMYEAAGLTQLGPVGTRNNDLEQTGWAFTNIRPNDYRGLTHAAEQPRTPITLDLVRHTDQTVDVSGDFLRPDRETPAPVIADQQLSLVTNVYNHGGKAVQGATFSLYDADPATGASPLATVTRDLGPYARDEVSFDYTPQAGLNELYVRASAAGDVTPGNDVVRTELEAWPAGASVLLVDDDFGWTYEEAYESVLNALGVPYAVVEGAPAVEALQAHDAVIWLTTSVSGAEGVLSTDAQAAIAAYLDGGGKLWLATTRAAGYLGTTDPGAEFLAGYFGFVAEQNLLNAMGTMEGLGDAIGGERTIAIGYLDGRPYLDYGAVAEGDAVQGTATGLLRHSTRPEHVVATKVEGEDGFRTVFGPPIAIVQQTAERLNLTREVLTFFGLATGAPSANELDVHYERFQHVQVGEDWPLTIGAVGPGGVSAVDVVYRPYGAADWQRLALQQEVTPGLWGGTIPGAHIANNGLEYYVEVTSGGATVQVDGGEAMPHVASAPYGDRARASYCLPGVGDNGARLWGEDRWATAVAVSQHQFPGRASASAVVLARGDEPTGFADALAGTPLAVAENAPLLITMPDQLLAPIEAEIVRVLGRGGTVYLLGGEQALSPAIEQRLTELGFRTQRVFGETRIETAVEIARALGDPDRLLITTGSTFPDALTAGAAAAQVDGAVLLTWNDQRHASTDAYLAERGDATWFAVGGPAARPYPEATPVFGDARIETAVAVADEFFDGPDAAGLAVQSKFPDSLTGGAHIARHGGPMLLTPADQLHGATAGYLCTQADSIDAVFTYGGTAVITDEVRAAAGARAAGEAC